MWPFSLFKKLSQDPAVGQTRGDYIGCYLLGTQPTGGLDQASYISLAISREQLEQETREFLQGFLQDNPGIPEQERKNVQNLLEHLSQRLEQHLSSATREPLLVQGEQELFLRTGMRARKKENGNYLE